MKILLIHPHDIFSPNEPWTIRITAIAKEFKKLGHEITLITFTLDGFINSPFMQDEIKIICLKRNLSIKYFFKKIAIISQLAKDHDIVFFQKCFHFASIPALLGAISNKKWLHYDWDDFETGIFFSGKKPASYLIGFLMFCLEKLLPLVSDSISVSSDFLKEKAIKIGVNKKFLVKVPVGATLKETNNENVLNIKNRYKLHNTINQIYIGQLHGAQYAELLINSCKKLKECGIITKTLIVGDGHDKNRLEKIVNDLKMNDDIIFTGYVPHDDINDYLNSCNIAIACFENNKITAAKSPLKIAEYLAAGKAIIAHNVGEIPFMLEEAGILVKSSNEDGLFEAIMSLHKNPILIKNYEQLALKQSQKFTWTKSATILHNFFSKTI